MHHSHQSTKSKRRSKLRLTPNRSLHTKRILAPNAALAAPSKTNVLLRLLLGVIRV
jgi:hypothetical protein